MKPTKEQLEQFNRHHLPEEPIEGKWLGNMSTKELADAYEEVQRELEMEKDDV